MATAKQKKTFASSKVESTYVCFLRGINVSGQKLIKMDQLRKSCEGLGLSKVRSYLQSGNLVFSAFGISPSDLVRKIEGRIKKDFQFEVAVFVKTVEEMLLLFREEPFSHDPRILRDRIFVTFLADEPLQEKILKLNTLCSKSQKCKCLGSTVYFYCPESYARSKLSNNSIERILMTKGTTRNWRTLESIKKMIVESRSLGG